MNPAFIGEMRKAIRGEGLDGWLFCNFRHRDRLADEILGVDPNTTNSRFWFYAVPAAGTGDGGGSGTGVFDTGIRDAGIRDALAILHAVEPDGLEPELPGQRAYYRSREELFARLAPLAGKRWGCHFSPFIPAVSYLDAGTAAMLEEAGLTLVSATGLVQRFKGLLSPAGMESHERAARHLYEIVSLAWASVQRSFAERKFAERKSIREGDIRQLMTEEFEKRNLVTDYPPIVAAGRNAANPHYDGAHNAVFIENDVIQFDLWAKERGEGGIYADISWVGVYGKTAPPPVEEAFLNLVQAREGAYQFIGDELAAGRRPAGADADRKAREILADFGYTEMIRHRTGHGIDTEAHGSGVNIDAVEFPDHRLLLDGSCFSLEPGIYFTDFGLRTEINVYIKDGKPYISGKDRQFALLRC